MYQRGEPIEPIEPIEPEPIEESNRRVRSFHVRYSVSFSVVILSVTFGSFIYIKLVRPFFIKIAEDYTHMYQV